MRNCGIDDLLERILSLDLLVENPKRDILKIDNIGIFAIKLDLFLDNTEHKLLLIRLLVRGKINFRLYCAPRLRGISALEQLLLNFLLPLFKYLMVVFVLFLVPLWVLANFALILYRYQFNPIWRNRRVSDTVLIFQF